MHELPSAERARVVHRLGLALHGEPAVLFAYLFGSFAEPSRFHDIDVAVYLDDRRVDSRHFLDEEVRLAAMLEASAGLPVDVVILNGAPIGLRMAAFRGRMLYSRDEALRLSIVERTALTYMDLAHLFRQSLADLLTPGRAE